MPALGAGRVIGGILPGRTDGWSSNEGRVHSVAHLLPSRALHTLDDYLSTGGGEVLENCRRLGPDGVIDTIRASGLRGRGGGGFPTGFKWAGLAAADGAEKYAVMNAAEGEPGTFKDRAILRRNPYQVIEGLAAAAYAIDADTAFIGIKEKATGALARIEAATAELSAAGLIGSLSITIVPGADDYLFGEEKGLLEAIEGKDPLPRLYPPYVQGLFEQPGGEPRPALVNNVETLANVPHILANGADWFRSRGTAKSPGTVVCTVGGDTTKEGVAEIELGTPLGDVLDIVGGGMKDGGPPRVILNGVSNSPLTSRHLGVAVSFEGMKEAGSGLGSAGFTFYDDTVCPTQVAAAASAFLFRGSCGQCPSCKLGTEAVAERFAALAIGDGSPEAAEEIAAWTQRITDSNRCGLGAGQQAIAAGFLQQFPDDLAIHAGGAACGGRAISITTIADWDETVSRFEYSPRVLSDRPGG